MKSILKICRSESTLNCRFCYADKPETIEHLKANIRGVIAEIGIQTLDKVHKH